MADDIARRLHTPGPKRMLALDGGGARGMISIGFLEEIEWTLRQRHGRDDLVLADYFDMIGGTSVGSILATMLALGWPMKQVRGEFTAGCKTIFGRSLLRRGLFQSRFNPNGLRKVLRHHLGDMTLDSDRLKTGLAIVAKRVDTGSAWVMTNNPASKFWETEFNEETGRPEFIGNRHYKVADIIRASTAAPTYFSPHRIDIHEPTETSDGKGLFVDGGLSPYNNPSLLLFMMAGIRGYRLGGTERVTAADNKQRERGVSWRLGQEQLLIVSVGAGDFRNQITHRRFRPSAMLGMDALMGLMSDNQQKTVKIMQWLANPNRSWVINSEVGDLSEDSLGQLIGGMGPMLSFERYDVKLEEKWLYQDLGLHYLPQSRLARLKKLDNPAELLTYEKLGRLAAAKQVSDRDFPTAFDLSLTPSPAAVSQ